ncbi:DUF6383 domain-containing protein [Parabacteroides gordonii]|uniref:DUF6383 domain-containing protein n=1 Tax=Parabacteroides gordonii TaxID=574930 RepID=UPI0026F08D96|nr:DUF6383 domain-containing protein [Parabacteroides gordonii]
MNKKFSTLLTMGLLMAGSLFSMANAQTNAKSLDLTDPTSYTAADLNKYYYIGLADGTYYLTLDEITNTDATDQSTVNGNKYYSLKGVAEGTNKADVIAEGDKALFKLNVSKAGTQTVFTLTSKSGKTVQFKATDNPTATSTTVIAAGDDAAAVGSYFSTISAVNFDGSTGATLIPFHGGTTANTNKLKLATTNFTIESTGTALVLYSIDENEMTATKLNELGNGTFSLTYKDATVTPFDGEMKAFEVSSITGVDDGTYLATSWSGLTAISSKADFQKCTFIALDSYNNWSINDLKANGEGYKFTTVSGKKLMENTSIELADMKKGYVSSANAAFTVTEKDPVNAADRYTLSLAAAKFMNAKKEAVVTASNLVIAAVADQEDLIVTSVTAGNTNLADFTTTCTLANSNLISVDKLLSTKAASVFNIQFQSTVNASDSKDKTISEYNKFLGINADGMFAQGSDFVNLEAPENQWIIVDADKDDKTFTFQNRELTDQTFTVKLIATGKTANTYKVVDVTAAPIQFDYAYVDKTSGDYTVENDADLDGTTIKLIEASVNPLAGYVTNELDNAGLVRFVFTSEQKTIADELYVAAGADLTKDLEVSKDAADALKWSVVKFDASADELDALVSDTIYAYNDYAYYDAAKKEVKVETAGDTIAVVAYGFKLYGKDKTYLNIASNKLKPSANDVEDVADAQRFLIKINKNGSYSLIEVPTAEIDYREIIQAATKAFTVDATANVENSTGTSIYYDYAGITYNFSIAKDEPTPSLAHKPAYVTLNADNKGYVAMDSVNFDGIVAPVSLLKSAYTSDDLTFRLDTADSEAYVPSFYISHIGKFMYNAKDSAEYYNDGTASAEGNKLYKLVDENAKAIFRAATLVSPDTLATTVNGKEAKVAVEESKGVLAGLNNFKYQIVQATADSEGEYVVKSVNDGYYLYNLNGFLGFTADPAKALVVSVEQSQSPVANEAVTTSSIKVIAGNGAVTVIGAQGKKVAVSNVLGQTVANAVLSSDNATISAPQGVVVVAVEGETAVKAIVK